MSESYSENSLPTRGFNVWTLGIQPFVRIYVSPVIIQRSIETARPRALKPRLYSKIARHAPNAYCDKGKIFVAAIFTTPCFRLCARVCVHIYIYIRVHPRELRNSRNPKDAFDVWNSRRMRSRRDYTFTHIRARARA